MSTPQLGMAYHCPLKTSALKNTADGKFCDQCSKHIPDMRNHSVTDVAEEIKKSDGEFCGTFDPLQLQNPFGDKRDKIVNWYQTISYKKRSKKSLLLLFGMAILFITGCRTRTTGVIGYSYRGMPVLRVHPRSIIEFTDSPDIVKHTVYKIHLPMKKEKKKKTTLKYKGK